MEVAHKELLQQIARLSETYANLADSPVNGSKTTARLRLSSLRQLAARSRSLQPQLCLAVQKQALEANNSAIAPGEITSLKDIQNLVETAAASEGKASIRDAALKVIDRVLAIAHCSQSDFAPLQSVQPKPANCTARFPNQPQLNCIPTQNP